MRSGSFELCVPAPKNHDARVHASAYSPACHRVMQADSARMAAFACAIADASAGKVVLDLGAGPDIVLALAAARAGAELVYALEGDRQAAAAAASLVARLEREASLPVGKVRVLAKHSMDLDDADIPLHSVTLLVHELMGILASSEAVLHFVEGVRRFLAPGCISVPHRAQTLVAPGALPPLQVLLNPAVCKERRRIGPGEKYLLCTGVALPPSLLRSAPQVFEDISFSDLRAREADPTGEEGGVERSFSFEVQSRGDFGGFYMWLRFEARAPPTPLEAATLEVCGLPCEPQRFRPAPPLIPYGAGNADAAVCDAWVSGESSSWPVLFLPAVRPIAVWPGDRVPLEAWVQGTHSLSPSYSLRSPCLPGGGSVRLGLADLYPFIGGDYCRACLLTVASDEEHRTKWARCSACAGAFHRACSTGFERPCSACSGSAATQGVPLIGSDLASCGAISTWVPPKLRRSSCTWRCHFCRLHTL